MSHKRHLTVPILHLKTVEHNIERMYYSAHAITKHNKVLSKLGTRSRVDGSCRESST